MFPSLCSVVSFSQQTYSIMCLGMSTNTRHSQLALGLCPPQMQLAALQCEPPVNCIVRLREGDDSNDHDDIEDDGWDGLRIR